MLQQALRRGPPYPMVLTRPDDEYWVDGTEHDTALDGHGDPVLPQHSWKPKIECDETAKCYRRHFLGKVSSARESGRVWSGLVWNQDMSGSGRVMGW